MSDCGFKFMSQGGKNEPLNPPDEPGDPSEDGGNRLFFHRPRKTIEVLFFFLVVFKMLRQNRSTSGGVGMVLLSRAQQLRRKRHED